MSAQALHTLAEVQKVSTPGDFPLWNALKLWQLTQLHRYNYLGNS